MKRNASLLTSLDMPGHSEREWHMDEQSGDKCPLACTARFVYRDGHFGYVANDGDVVFPSRVPYSGPIIVHAQYFGSKAFPSIISIGTRLGLAQAQLAALILSRCEYIRPCVRHFKPLPSLLPVADEEQPDLTLADKEWIDKIDGHSLRVEDLY